MMKLNPVWKVLLRAMHTVSNLWFIAYAGVTLAVLGRWILAQLL